MGGRGVLPAALPASARAPARARGRAGMPARVGGGGTNLLLLLLQSSCSSQGLRHRGSRWPSAVLGHLSFFLTHTNKHKGKEAS